MIGTGEINAVEINSAGAGGIISDFATDSFELEDTVSSAIYDLLTDGFIVDDGLLKEILYQLVQESLQLEASVLVLGLSISDSVGVHFTLADGVSTFLSEPVSESTTLADSLAAEYIAAHLRDTLTLVATGTDTGTFGNSLEDGFTLADAATEYFSQLVADDSMTLADAATQFLSSSAPVTDTLTLVDSVTALLHALDTVSDSFILVASKAADPLTGSNTVTDTLELGDKVFLPPPGLAWSAHVESMGMSQYTQFPYTDLAGHDGTLLAVSEDGLSVIDDSAEQGAAIDAELTLGATDFGEPRLKQFPRLLLSYIADGQLRVQLKAANWPGKSPALAYAKTLPRQTEFPAPIPMRPGKGLKSRYVQFVLSNLDGADFELHDMLVETHILDLKY